MESDKLKQLQQYGRFSAANAINQTPGIPKYDRDHHFKLHFTAKNKIR